MDYGRNRRRVSANYSVFALQSIIEATAYLQGATAMTIFPFFLPEKLIHQLPAPRDDGYCYIDVLVHGKWDGVLVTKPDGSCIGIYIRRAIEQLNLPFRPHDIERVRQASTWNLLLTSIPFSLFKPALLSPLFVTPLLLALAASVLSPLYYLVIILSAFSCYVLTLPRGFIVFRPLAMLLAIAQLLAAVIALLRQ